MRDPECVDHLSASTMLASLFNIPEKERCHHEETLRGEAPYLWIGALSYRLAGGERTSGKQNLISAMLTGEALEQRLATGDHAQATAGTRSQDRQDQAGDHLARHGFAPGHFDAAIQRLRQSRLSLQSPSPAKAWSLPPVEFHEKGKSSTQFVRQHDLPLVRQQVRNYQRLRTLLDRWITLGMELSRLRLHQEREARAVSSLKKRTEAGIS
jgi:hypothetical protein